jgi:CubicO group peptidase (beta-lactamase class C family)
MNLFLLAAAMTTSAAAQSASPLERCIAARAEKLEFSGVISVVQANRSTTVARGVLDGPGSPEISAGSRFNLGSAGKMFTAVAVAQLVGAGKVGLEDAIGRHVDGLSPQTAAVTVRQLLTHSSGLGNFFAPENLPAIEKARTVSDLLPLVASETPAFPPGSRFRYSSTGFLLLGRLVERVSGQSYGQHLAEHVFGPARMTASGLDPGPSPVQAAGMTARAGLPLKPAPEAALHGNPAGGTYSTAADMQRFFAALLGGQLTSTSMLGEMMAPQIVAMPAKGAAPQLDHGLGFGVGTFEGHRWFGHNGGAPGVNVEAAAFPADRITVVVLSNRDPPAATAVFRELRAALFVPGGAGTCAAPSSPVH